MGMAAEFRDFISRGNVVDLAVGVIVGAAFGKIVASLVEQVVMPPIGLLLGKVDFSNLKWVLAPAGGERLVVDHLEDWTPMLGHLTPDSAPGSGHAPARGRHPRDVRVLPGSRDFH